MMYLSIFYFATISIYSLNGIKDLEEGLSWQYKIIASSFFLSINISCFTNPLFWLLYDFNLCKGGVQEIFGSALLHVLPLLLLVVDWLCNWIEHPRGYPLISLLFGSTFCFFSLVTEAIGMDAPYI